MSWQIRGYRGYIPSYEALMKDIDLLLNIGEKNFKGLPLFCMDIVSGEIRY